MLLQCKIAVVLALKITQPMKNSEQPGNKAMIVEFYGVTGDKQPQLRTG